MRDGTDGLAIAHTLRAGFCADIVTLVVDDLDPDFNGLAVIMREAIVVEHRIGRLRCARPLPRTRRSRWPLLGRASNPAAPAEGEDAAE